MADNPILTGKRGEKHLLLGNEAIVRGALEAGVDVVTCYPGTPSSEVPDTFYRLQAEEKKQGITQDKSRFYLEYSVNEKVAFEVAAGAALAGGMSLVTMKHVGLNVAADPLFTAAYIGLPGGMVVLAADDPGCHSSQNEQDSRHYARASSLPCFEPASPQEAHDMASAALKMARILQQPILLRTTTRTAHARGPVVFDDLPEKQPISVIDKMPERFVPVPAGARLRHRILLENLQNAMAMAEDSQFTREHGPQVPLGIVSSGIARGYLADALYEAKWEEDVRVLELGITWPLPQARILRFLNNCQRVLILEEGDPLLEQSLRAMAQEHHCTVQIEGKDEICTPLSEYSTFIVKKRLAKFLNKTLPDEQQINVNLELPARPPNLCAGCSHRSVYYAVRQVFGDEAWYGSDIGCYTLGMLPPLRMADFLICMGASISAGSGFALASKKDVVAFIGDSTFFHSGMTSLANAVFNKHNILVVILDNGTTAMTGHQPNPGMDQEALGDTAVHLDIESIVRGLGVTQFRQVSSFRLDQVIKTLEELKQQSGVRVLLAQEPCTLYARRQKSKAKKVVATVAQQGADAKRCFETFACPAFSMENDILEVNPEMCTGCMSCLHIAPKAFKAKKLD